jgi:hypothetical protein
MTRTSRRGAFFGSRLATLMTSLIPRRWDVRRLHRIERRTIKPGAKGRLEPFARDTGRELYHQFGNIVGGVLSSLIVKKFRAWPITAAAPVELDEIDHSSSEKKSFSSYWPFSRSETKVKGSAVLRSKARCLRSP